VSPVLFVIYLSGLFGKVEKQEDKCGSEGISLTMMWHGWWKARMWGNAHKD